MSRQSALAVAAAVLTLEAAPTILSRAVAAVQADTPPSILRLRRTLLTPTPSVALVLLAPVLAALVVLVATLHLQ
jgi:hypothetical protein